MRDAEANDTAFSASRLPGPPLGVRQGYVWDGEDRSLLAAVVEAAFDYRGDVTLRLGSGEELVGYVYNREAAADEPFLEVLPADGGPARTVLYRELRSVAFTGRDAASETPEGR